MHDPDGAAFYVQCRSWYLETCGKFSRAQLATPGLTEAVRSQVLRASRIVHTESDSYELVSDIDHVDHEIHT
jgi:hypothetical protein